MDHLASCYFCGTALDETLRAYRVVPATSGEDDPTTATLCQSCHGKLEAIFDRVTGETEVSLDAVGAPPATQSTADRSADGETVDETAAEDAASIELLDPDADEGLLGADTGGDDPAGERDRQPGTVENTEAETDPTDTESEESTDEEGEEGILTGDYGEDETTDGILGGDRTADAGEDEPGEDSASPTDTARNEGPTDEAARNEEPTDEAATDETGGDGSESGRSGSHKQILAEQSISVREYNKVIRLLKNREFPVDRADIETVASNAYELDHRQVEEIIDVALDRELLGQEDGKLIRQD